MGETAVREADRSTEADGMTAWDPQRLIAVTVGQGGIMRGVEIEPDAYSYLTPRQLAETVNRTYEDAVTALREATVAQFMDLCGVKLEGKEVASGKTRLHNLLHKLAGHPSV